MDLKVFRFTVQKECMSWYISVFLLSVEYSINSRIQSFTLTVYIYIVFNQYKLLGYLCKNESSLTKFISETFINL